MQQFPWFLPVIYNFNIFSYTMFEGHFSKKNTKPKTLQKDKTTNSEDNERQRKPSWWWIKANDGSRVVSIIRAGIRCIAFTCRWRLPLSRRAWKELGVSIVCCRDRPAWGTLTEVCRNHGNDILRRVLCCFVCASPTGGGVVPIAAARTAVRERATAECGRVAASVRCGTRRSRHCRRAPPASRLSRSTSQTRSLRSLRIELHFPNLFNVRYEGSVWRTRVKHLQGTR